jgi:exodeoxyribonuclease VII small subunit
VSEKKKLTYGKAIAELQGIISEIERESIDVDVLAEKVKRATYLIKYCKEHLRTTEEEVKNILSEIQEKSEESGDDEEPF